MPIGTTITEFIIEEQRQIKGVSGDFTALVNDVVIACKAISSAVRYGSLVGVLGTADTENIQGETQKKLDVISNNLFIKRNEWAGHVAAMASEEMNDVYHLPSQYPRGKYLLIFDPLDGSSNTDVNGAVGTIFSILRRAKDAEGEPTEDDFMQPGDRQVCAGYALYGPSSMMVLTTGHGVKRLHSGPAHRRIHPDQPQHEDSTGYSGLFHQRCLHALLLMYEANPMSFIVEQAGGLATTGTQRIMELQPNNLHQRCPVIMGSRNEVERIISYHLEAQ